MKEIIKRVGFVLVLAVAVSEGLTVGVLYSQHTRDERRLQSVVKQVGDVREEATQNMAKITAAALTVTQEATGSVKRDVSDLRSCVGKLVSTYDNHTHFESGYVTDGPSERVGGPLSGCPSRFGF